MNLSKEINGHPIAYAMGKFKMGFQTGSGMPIPFAAVPCHLPARDRMAAMAMAHGLAYVVRWCGSRLARGWVARGALEGVMALVRSS